MRAAAAATRTSCWDPASVCINYIVLYRAVMHELCNYSGTRATLSPKTCRCNCGGKPNIVNDITIRYITQSHVSSGGETITRLLSKRLVNLSHRHDFCTTDFCQLERHRHSLLLLVTSCKSRPLRSISQPGNQIPPRASLERLLVCFCLCWIRSFTERHGRRWNQLGLARRIS